MSAKKALTSVGDKLDLITPEAIERQAREVTPAHLSKVTSQRDEIVAAVRGAKVLKPHEEGVLEMLTLLADVAADRYRSAPYSAIAVMVYALSYVLEPEDLIPDDHVLVGRVDDAVVLERSLEMVSDALGDYREWRKKHS